MAVILIPAVASLVLASVAACGGIKKSTAGTLLPGQFPLALNFPQPTLLQTNILYGLRTQGGPLTDSPILVPGNYQSQPYTCLIAVPEPTHDLCCIGGKPGIDPEMHISRPEIQFIPRATP